MCKCVLIISVNSAIVALVKADPNFTNYDLDRLNNSNDVHKLQAKKVNNEYSKAQKKFSSELDSASARYNFGDANNMSMNKKAALEDNNSKIDDNSIKENDIAMRFILTEVIIDAINSHDELSDEKSNNIISNAEISISEDIAFRKITSENIVPQILDNDDH